MNIAVANPILVSCSVTRCWNKKQSNFSNFAVAILLNKTAFSLVRFMHKVVAFYVGKQKYLKIIKQASVLRKTHHCERYSDGFQNSPKVDEHLGYFCQKTCHQGLLKLLGFAKNQNAWWTIPVIIYLTMKHLPQHPCPFQTDQLNPINLIWSNICSSKGVQITISSQSINVSNYEKRGWYTNLVLLQM